MAMDVNIANYRVAFDSPLELAVFMPDGRRAPYFLTGAEVAELIRADASECAADLFLLRHRGLKSIPLSNRMIFRLEDVLQFVVEQSERRSKGRPEVLTERQAAEFLRIESNHIDSCMRRLRSQGLKAFKVGGHFRYKFTELLAFLERRVEEFER